MGVELTNQIPFFLESFLSKPASALPKGAQWVLIFDPIPTTLIKRIASGWEPRKWNIDKAIEQTNDNSNYMNKKGCLFVQAAEIPSEGTVINAEGLQYNGFLRTNIGAGREAYSTVQIIFLDTNISFADNVIRPWVITTSHLGMMARGVENGVDYNYRCNFTLYKLGVKNRKDPPKITQKVTFIGGCPVSVGSEELNYSPVTSPSLRSTTFTFHYYTVEGPQSTF
jgi:hypothetical protein